MTSSPISRFVLGNYPLREHDAESYQPLLPALPQLFHFGISAFLILTQNKMAHNQGAPVGQEGKHSYLGKH